MARILLCTEEDMEKGRVLVIKHIECEGLGHFEGHIKEGGFKIEYINTEKGGWRNDPSGFDALILMGGPMGVYETDRYPFLLREMDLIRSFYRMDKPVLGICLGAQLIAQALGGKVYRGDRKEIGWYRIYLTGEGRRDPLFEAMPDVPVVFQWHGDTFELPDDGVRLAYSYIYPNQAFRVGDRVYGLQFHLEVTEEMVCSWIAEYRDELEREGIRTAPILEGTERYIHSLNGYAEGFIRRFLRLIIQNA